MSATPVFDVVQTAGIAVIIRRCARITLLARRANSLALTGDAAGAHEALVGMNTEAEVLLGLTESMLELEGGA
jgi:hypothetical protein